MGTVTKLAHPVYRYFSEDNRGSPQVYTRGQDLWREKTGYPFAGWKQRVQNHESATTDFSGLIETAKVKANSGVKVVADIAAPNGERVYKVDGHLSAVQYPMAFHGTFISDAAAYDQAISKALKQIHKEMTAFSGGVFLGEAGEALKMLSSPAKALRNALKETYLDRIKREKGQSQDRWKRAISQTWLEGCFGWLPFVNDLRDASTAWNKLNDRKERYAKIKGVGREDDVLIYLSEDLWAPYANFYWISSVKEYAGARVIVRGEVRARAEMTPMDKLSLFGLSPGEFIPTAWELLPWSFLIDYFSNIGDVLENGVTDTRNVTWAQTSRINYLRKEVITWTSSNIPQNADALRLGGSRGQVVYQRKTVGRTKENFEKLPSLRFELPSLPRQHANILALWVQANAVHPQQIPRLGRRGFPTA